MSVLHGLQVKYNKQLLPEQAVAKELGLTKKELRILLVGGTLTSVQIDNKYYVSLIALAAFLGDKQTIDYGQQNAGLQPYTELEQGNRIKR